MNIEFIKDAGVLSHLSYFRGRLETHSYLTTLNSVVIVLFDSTKFPDNEFIIRERLGEYSIARACEWAKSHSYKDNYYGIVASSKKELSNLVIPEYLIVKMVRLYNSGYVFNENYARVMYNFLANKIKIDKTPSIIDKLLSHA